jgi:hypothetical protein
MSLRAALVDDLKTVTAVTDIVSDRISDMFYEFEDFLNSSANSVSKFPAVSIVNDSNEYEPNLDGHDSFRFASYTIVCYQVVNQSKMKSRSVNVRNKERDKLRIVDTLAETIADYLADKRDIITNVGGEQYKLRQPHIESIADDVAESADNREVVTREITYTILYSKEN